MICRRRASGDRLLKSAFFSHTWKALVLEMLGCPTMHCKNSAKRCAAASTRRRPTFPFWTRRNDLRFASDSVHLRRHRPRANIDSPARFIFSCCKSLLGLLTQSQPLLKTSYVLCHRIGLAHPREFTPSALSPPSRRPSQESPMPQCHQPLRSQCCRS